MILSFQRQDNCSHVVGEVCNKCRITGGKKYNGRLVNDVLQLDIEYLRWYIKESKIPPVKYLSESIK